MDHLIKGISKNPIKKEKFNKIHLIKTIIFLVNDIYTLEKF